MWSIRVSPVLKCPSYYEKCWRNKNSSVVDLNDYRQAGGIRKLLGPKFEDVDALDRASVWNQLNSHYGSMSYTSYQSVKGVDLKNYVIIHPSLLQRLLRPQSCNCASKRKVTAAGQNVKRLGNTTRGKGKQPKKPAISKPLKKKKVQDNLRAKKFYKCIFCKKNYRCTSSLHCQTRKHIDDEKCQCHVCPLSCRLPGQVQGHEGLRVKSEFPETPGIQECRRQPKRTCRLRQYFNVSCRICELTFGNQGELEAHYVESHKLPVVRVRRLVITTK